MDSERISPPLPAPDSPERGTAFIRPLLAYAAAALCDESAAYSAVSEAVISAAEKQASASASEREAGALKALLRLCAARSAETAPAWQEDSALAPTARLPFQSRSDLALMLSELPSETVSAASGIPEQELSDRCDKAMRQLRFLQHGQAPDIPAMKRALHGSPQLNERADALSAEILKKLEARQKDVPAAEKTAGKIHRITRSTAAPESPKHRTVRVPLWAVICGAAVFCGLTAALAFAVFRKPAQPAQPGPPPESESDMPAPEYIRQVAEQRAPALAEAQDTVLKEAGMQPEDVIFLSTKLSSDNRSPRYTVVFLDQNGKQYEYITEGGRVILQSTSETDDIPNTAGWHSREELRLLAMESADLETAVFTKEKLGTDGDIYYYKFEFTGDGSREYSANYDVRTASLLRYSVKDADPPDDASLIPQETAKMKALARAGDLKPDQVVFTKEKQEGTVWMIAFTLDDGTQYTVELNARTGMANAVDVRPVSADTSQLIGTLAARDMALRRAGLPETVSARFTKAKIDRSGGVYVYEFEFQTANEEYEVTLNASTGEMLKYRIWML